MAAGPFTSEAFDNFTRLGVEGAGVWDDLRFPASKLQINPATSKPDSDFTIGGLLFDATNTEMVIALPQLPHEWAEGTTLIPHVHWEKTTSAAGNVYWQLEYRWAPIGVAHDAEWTTLGSATAVAGGGDVADVHTLTVFGEISGAGKHISDMLICHMSRVPGNAADNYAADARLLEFDIHYLKDGGGSIEQFTKT